MKKELDEFITVLDDAVDMQDNGRYQDLLDSFYQDGLFHEFRRYLNKQAERVQELEAQNEGRELAHKLVVHYAKESEKQNKRYRATINAMGQILKDAIHSLDVGEKVQGMEYGVAMRDKALEGEE